MDAPWRIELFGGLRASQRRRVISLSPTQKTGALLAYLASHSQYPQPREVLMELLWPEIDPASAQSSLRSTLRSLREMLEPESAARAAAVPLLIADRRTVHLDPAAFTTDVAEFRAALQAAARANDLRERAGCLTTGLALYQGELLPGFTEPWVTVERQQLSDLFLYALQQLAAAWEQAGDLKQALEVARRLVAADPLREEAHYDLMRLYAAAGQPSATLRQYQELERLLEELGETPSAATRALAEELRNSARTIVVARSSAGRVQRGQERSDTRGGRERSHRAHTQDEEALHRGDERTGGASAPPALPAPGLPAQFSRFFGREEEIARLAETLCRPATRLVTLTGPGGSGKTRLAIAVAGRLQAEFGGAVCFVPLAELSEARRLGDALRDALGLPPSGDGEPLEQVAAALRAGPALLVLDNFEQLVADGAALVRRLLERAPELTCLITSRQRLELEGEQEFVVLPLPTPRASDFGFWILDFGLGPTKASDLPQSLPMPAIQNRKSKIQNSQALLQYPSVALFVDRAQAARPGFELNEGNAPAVAALCDRLEGLPLAIELAAARAAVLTPAQMLTRLQVPAARASALGPGARAVGRGRFELLVSHRRDVSARHRSLRAAIEWSYQLLAPELQRFFRQLSVFPGSFTLEAAEDICAEGGIGGRGLGVGDEPTPDPTPALEFLQQLQQSSLVVAEEAGYTAEMTIRYRLLETLREYAGEQLSPEERQALEERYARYFLAFVETREGAPAVEERQKRWLREQDAEYANVRAALEWALTADPAAALRVAHSLGKYWHLRGYWAEAVDFLSRAARWRSEETGLERCSALRDAGALAFELGDYPRAQALLEEAVAQGRQLGVAEYIGAALHNLGEVAVGRGDYEAAWSHFQDSLEVRRADPRLPPVHSTGPLAGLGDVARALGDFETARAYYEESLTIFRAIGDRRHAALRRRDLGFLLQRQGEHEAAERYFRDALATLQGYGDRSGASLVLQGLGDAALARHDHTAARAFYCESLTALRQLGHRQGIAAGLEGMARLAQVEGRLPHAARLWGAAHAVREAIGSRPSPHEQPERDAELAALRRTLGPDAFTAAWEAGLRLSWEQAAELALAE